MAVQCGYSELFLFFPPRHKCDFLATMIMKISVGLVWGRVGWPAGPPDE